ncbi:hypothetical protein K525DRAFT_281532 [Schizophyllum commune Loenen D]|nr:hypothetical protein K525DRAFT_281532 [Schizophyllum commune Loenen D]
MISVIPPPRWTSARLLTTPSPSPYFLLELELLTWPFNCKTYLEDLRGKNWRDG